MEPRILKLGPADYRTSAWSGGTTTQLAIFPPEAVYADRDFLWRISSATVDLEASDFTPLPDYDRLICTLRGEITLTHNSEAPIRLRPYQIHAFSGADRTHSEGRCTDFNLMLRRGEAEGDVTAILVDQNGITIPDYRADQILLCCAEGSCAVRLADRTEELRAGESLLISADGMRVPCVTARTTDRMLTARLLLCRMRRV